MSYFQICIQDLQNMTRIGVNTFIYNQPSSAEENFVSNEGKELSILLQFQSVEYNKIQR